MERHNSVLLTDSTPIDKNQSNVDESILNLSKGSFSTFRTATRSNSISFYSKLAFNDQSINKLGTLESEDEREKTPKAPNSLIGRKPVKAFSYKAQSFKEKHNCIDQSLIIVTFLSLGGTPNRLTSASLPSPIEDFSINSQVIDSHNYTDLKEIGKVHFCAN